MKRSLLLTAVGLFASAVFAGPDVLPVDGVRYVHYDAATGEITPITAETRRLGHHIWGAGYEYVGYYGYYWGREYDLGEAGSDWGDVAGPAVVGGFEFSQWTNSRDDDGDLWITILFYTDDNGFGSAGKAYTAGILIDNIPGYSGGGEVWGYRWLVELDVPFVLDGSDLDGDGLVDFGYFMFCSGRTPGGLHGPGVWDRALVDPNNLPPEAPGVEDAVDGYADPNWNLGFHNIDPNNINAAHYGSGTFSVAYGQIHMRLFDPGCPNRGDSGRYCEADIGEVDCIVGLADLAQLLSNYGCQSDPNGPDVCTVMMGDVDPYDEWFAGDGDIDLNDLGELLSQYGDDCNWP